MASNQDYGIHVSYNFLLRGLKLIWFGVAADGAQAASAGLSSVADQDREVAGKEGEEGAAPPKDERTWLQKNWLILLPLAVK